MAHSFREFVQGPSFGAIRAFGGGPHFPAYQLPAMPASEFLHANAGESTYATRERCTAARVRVRAMQRQGNSKQALPSTPTRVQTRPH